MNENTTFCFKNFQDTIVRASTPVVEKEKEQRLDQGKERKEKKKLQKKNYKKKITKKKLQKKKLKKKN